MNIWKDIKFYIEALTWSDAISVLIQGTVVTIATIAAVLIFIWWPL